MIPVFFTKVRATGTRLTAGNGPGRNTNWSVVDEVSMLVPILVLRELDDAMQKRLRPIQV
jgi:hypothetical protein